MLPFKSKKSIHNFSPSATLYLPRNAFGTPILSGSVLVKALSLEYLKITKFIKTLKQQHYDIDCSPIPLVIILFKRKNIDWFYLPYLAVYVNRLVTCGDMGCSFPYR